MKKLLLTLILLALSTAAFSGPLIDAAKKNDYKSFAKLVKNHADLTETDKNGMNVQLALAYFDNANFKKACSLLAKKKFDFDQPVANNVSLLYALAYSCSYEKITTLLKYKVDVNRKNSVTGLAPIDATQFSTFKFFSSQVIPEDAYDRAEKTRQVLLDHGSQEFKYCDLTFGNVGNFFFCLVNIIGSFNPFISPQMLNSYNLFDYSTTDHNQTLVTVNQELMVEVFREFGIEVTVNNYYNPDEILEQLILTAEAEDAYALIASTSRNPIATYQWVNVNGGSFLVDKALSADLGTTNPDMLFDFVAFQAKDIGQLVTIKMRFMEEELSEEFSEE